MKKKILLPVYFLMLGLFLVWSYSLTDRNLVILQWQPYLTFQNAMWSLTPQLVTVSYSILVSCLLLLYWKVIALHRIESAKTSLFGLPLIAVLPIFLIFSYNALSHDIFNYMFNAKMVLIYQADPHIHSAIEFGNDAWLRFMHNVHTPAPYFYGWTLLSLLPFVIGLGKFLTTWLGFKLFSAVGWLILIWTQRQLLIKLKLPENSWWEFVFHPLVLIELLAVSHNDGWMMALALLSFLVLTQPSKLSISRITTSFALLLLSASLKYVTLVLLPVWIFMVLKQMNKVPKIQFAKILEKYTFELAAILLFLPLLSARSQWFHPWYLVWSLSFLPFIKMKWLKVLLLSFSISSLYRYIPWMWNGAFEYTPAILAQEVWITWGLGLLLFGCWFLFHYRYLIYSKS